MASRRFSPATGTILTPSSAGSSNAAAGSRVVITTRPDAPAGHSPSRSLSSARSSRTRAHGRRVWASQATKRAAAVSAPSSGRLASTVSAARAKPVMTDSRLATVTQTRISTAWVFHMAWANSTASCVLPVPPCAAGASSVSAPWTSTAVSSGRRLLARSGPVCSRGKYASASGGTVPDSSTPDPGPDTVPACCATMMDSLSRPLVSPA